jgi:uncharacterized protein involved in exopolysaccharide biosynthesis
VSHFDTFDTAQATPDEERPARSLRSLLHVLFRWKWPALAFFVLCVVGARIYTAYFSMPIYESTTQLLVTPGRENITDLTLPTRRAVPPWVRFDIEEETARAREILTGRFLAERVVDALGVERVHAPTAAPGLLTWLLHEQPGEDKRWEREAVINAFMQSVSVEAPGRSSILNLSVKHPDPEIAAQAANLLADHYLGRVLGMQKNPRADAFVEEQARLLRQKLSESEGDMQAFKQRHGITFSVSDEQLLLRQQQMVLRKDLSDAKAREAELQSKDAEIRSLLAEHGSLYGNLQADLERQRAEESATRARQEALAAKVAELQGRLDGLERISGEYSQREKQLKTDEENYRLYLTKAQESRVSGAMDAERIGSVRVIEPARVPLVPLESKRRKVMLVAIVVGTAGALALAYLLQYLKGTLDTAEDVERELGLPVLASIPRSPRAARRIAAKGIST